jgi:hypothetical protein
MGRSEILRQPDFSTLPPVLIFSTKYTPKNRIFPLIWTALILSRPFGAGS